MFSSDDHIFPTKPQLIREDNRTVFVKSLVPVLLMIAFFLVAFQENYLLILQLLGVLAFHEVGHWVTSKILKSNSYQFNVFPGVAGSKNTNHQTLSQKKRTWILMMGPLPGIVIGCVLLLNAFKTGSDLFLFELGMLFVFINLLNFFPIDPLDGGKVIETMFFPSNQKTKLYFTLVSSFAVIALGWWLQFWILIAFGFLMGLKVRSIQKNQKIYEDLNDIDFDYNQSYEELSDREYWTLRRIFLDHNPKVKELIPNRMELWENEKLIFEQVRTLLFSRMNQDLSLAGKIFVIILMIASIVAPIYIIVENWEFINNYVEQQAI